MNLSNNHEWMTISPLKTVLDAIEIIVCICWIFCTNIHFCIVNYANMHTKFINM